MKSGIYIVVNNNNGRVYVGQSKNTKARLGVHRRYLEKNKHPNTYLQRDYLKYKGLNFKYEILESCLIDKLDEREIYWISFFKSIDRKSGYNRETGGHIGKVYDAERILSITGANNPMYGKKQSSEVKIKIRNANRGRNNKLKISDIEKIKKLLLQEIPQKKIAEKYDVTISTISKIYTCINWEWVSKELNTGLIDLEKRKEKQRKQKNNEKLQKKEKEQKKLELKNKKYAEVRKAYLEGASKSGILEKFKISKTTFVRITTDLFNSNKQNLIKEVNELKKKGMLNKDIAQKLNIHRTTVTEYLKKK